MTPEEFEAWLDEQWPELYHKANSKADDEFCKLQTAKREGACAAWARANDIIGQAYKTSIEKLDDYNTLAQKADKLAEAVDNYCYGRTDFFMLQKTLKEYRGEAND